MLGRVSGVSGKGFLAPGNGKLKITFPFYGKGTGIRKLLREGKGNLRLVIPGIPGNPGNHIKSKIKFKIIFMP